MSVADYAEIVKALRLCSAVNSSCEECPCNDPADDLCECANKVSIAAADAIENLRTENAALRRMIGNLTSAQAVMVKEFEGKMEELHDSKSELSAAIAGRETVTNRNAFNVPLTLDKLREAAETGDPVWLVGLENEDRWVHIDGIDSLVVRFSMFGNSETWCFRTASYGVRVWAYRQKQKED